MIETRSDADNGKAVFIGYPNKKNSGSFEKFRYQFIPTKVKRPSIFKN